jgi:glycosyltransferase involved in cell wall biosynthesis
LRRRRETLKSPRVSVLVTVYNREAFLEASLRSILASDFDDFEVIVVDDQSSDGSVAIARRIAETDPRVKVFVNDRNLGDYPNRARAASLAAGDYLKYVDSDDVIYPHSLSIMVEAMDSHPDAAVGLSQQDDEPEPFPVQLSPVEAWHRQFLGRGCLGCGPTGAIIRRSSFEKAGGFREWGLLSDIDMWLRLTKQWPVVLLQPALVWWRRHDSQEFNRSDAAQFYLSKGFALIEDSLNSTDCPLPPAERREALKVARRRHARSLVGMAVKKGRPQAAWTLLQESRISSGEVLGALMGRASSRK